MGKHSQNATFLASVEASCCARQLRNQFWEALPFLLAMRESNGAYAISEAIEDVAKETYKAFRE